MGLAVHNMLAVRNVIYSGKSLLYGIILIPKKLDVHGAMAFFILYFKGKNSLKSEN